MVLIHLRVLNAVHMILLVIRKVAQNERSHIHENAERVENGVLHDDTAVCVNK